MGSRFFMLISKTNGIRIVQGVEGQLGICATTAGYLSIHIRAQVLVIIVKGVGLFLHDVLHQKITGASAAQPNDNGREQLIAKQ